MKSTIILILGLLVTSGCASSRLPPRLAAIDQGRIKPLDVTVGVEEYHYPVYSENLKNDLRKTKLFKAVDLRRNLPLRPDLVAYVEEPIHGKAVIPCMTILSLGIIPTTVTEQHGQVLSFGYPDDPTRSVRVEFTYDSTSMLGWAALFLNLSPNWSVNPQSNRRYLEGLSLAISTNAQAIEDLTKRK